MTRPPHRPESDAREPDTPDLDRRTTDQPGADQPGGDQPGADQPGADQPGAEPPYLAPRGDGQIADWTDIYFTRTREVVERHGDSRVTYAVFLRPPVVSAPRLAIEWLERVMAERGGGLEIDLRFEEGRWVGAGEPILYVTGPFSQLSECETLLLQKLGLACVAASNAYAMCAELPQTPFIAMEARHCAGREMEALAAYGASVGSRRAQRKLGARGFVGNSVAATAHFFGQDHAFGTMPHALIGYAGSTLKACRMFHETHPDIPLVALVDYFGQEITDTLEVARAWPDLAAAGKVSTRLDTPGSRYCEGLDPSESYKVLERHCPEAIRGYRTDEELKYLIGPGVSAAAIWHMREQLDRAGFGAVRILASSGFSPAKCRMIAEADCPVDMVGSGSFLPERWTDTNATADIVEYDGVKRVKKGREFLHR